MEEKSSVRISKYSVFDQFKLIKSPKNVYLWRDLCFIYMLDLNKIEIINENDPIPECYGTDVYTEDFGFLNYKNKKLPVIHIEEVMEGVKNRIEKKDFSFYEFYLKHFSDVDEYRKIRKRNGFLDTPIDLVSWKKRKEWCTCMIKVEKAILSDKKLRNEIFSKYYEFRWKEIIRMKSSEVGHKFIKRCTDPREILVSNIKKVCFHCLKEKSKITNGGKDENYKRCKKCKVTYYCSKKCQRLNWKIYHRYVCKFLKNRFNPHAFHFLYFDFVYLKELPIYQKLKELQDMMRNEHKKHWSHEWSCCKK